MASDLNALLGFHAAALDRRRVRHKIGVHDQLGRERLDRFAPGRR